MDHAELQQRFSALTTAHVADGCIRAQVAVSCAPPALQAVRPNSHVAGRVCPTRHAGSVDIFLEAFESAALGDVLVVDNGGRLDETCVGDLVALEAQTAGLGGMVDSYLAARTETPSLTFRDHLRNVGGAIEV